jgi:hypothetical protein
MRGVGDKIRFEDAKGRVVVTADKDGSSSDLMMEAHKLD